MSEPIAITLPDIGDFKDVPIVDILVKPGDTVAMEDLLLTVESDKAAMEVPSPAAGTIKELKVSVGTRVSQGALLMWLEPAAASRPQAAPITSEARSLVREETPAPAGAIAAPPPSTPPSPPASAPSGAAHATPSVRAFARELGVDLSAIKPSGPKGRILREDVSAHVKSALARDTASGPTGSGIGAGLPAWPSPDYAKFGAVEREPLTRIQKLSGANLTRNWLTIPHVTNFDKADVTDLEAFRLKLNGEKHKPDAKVTMVALLVKASAIALKTYPRFNASLDGDELVLKKYVHIGFAADTPQGLMVPVIRDCDRKGILEIASDLRALADKARDGTLTAAEMQGGCFSVSSLGGIGGAGFTPIINAPEVAILGAGRAAHEAVWDGTAFQPRLVLPISLSWDHRVVDGVAAARFLGHIAMLLADFRRAIL
jgi:pyruvate dehydrogenase E2 component (dihydrolipoamide acetyltransferase)